METTPVGRPGEDLPLSRADRQLPHFGCLGLAVGRLAAFVELAGGADGSGAPEHATISNFAA